ncbi:coiled-coil domain-containing protein 66 isoform X2 [Perognathus longimembris pacificus]|uniref:coiled-coil domain-containing protein 66 isoform X2 n=1 Tax=Perognathus longimembris pacificus TaxID=214514 RepID=UPI0020194149|nr:coiled-coil domain-containing protein 66 isoform X2 [Perognathus longimembris pacificus]
MNLGDGLKLETELLHGKPRIILSPYEHKSKISVKMGNKSKITKCPLGAKHAGHILKSTQHTYIASEKLLQRKTVGSETSQLKSEKNRMTLSPTKDFYKQYADKDCLHTETEVSSVAPNIQKTRNTINPGLVIREKPHKKHNITENMNSSVVCLTQDQLQQILMTINQGNGSVSLTNNENNEKKSQDSLHFKKFQNEPEDENIMGLLPKNKTVSSILDDNESLLNKNQEASEQYEQKTVIKNKWQPADIFSTLGERERDKSLLEAKRAQWRKELDEQVALKKKEKEASEKWNHPWKKPESDKIVWEKLQILNQSKTSADSSNVWLQSPCQVTMADGYSLLRDSQILESQEHDRWAVHFDSLKNHPGSQSRLSSQFTPKHPEYFCVSPDTQDLADVSSVYTLTPGSHIEPSEEEHIVKPVSDVAVANSQKTNFLRSMTALLDPAQIEERDRRRQKQLEHQKAITAQVEEKRRKKQLEEEQRRKEEQEEEQRLLREREEMQKQYEEDIVKQKQKEEIMTLKTNELFQKMQRAQELAHRLKQEQRIRDLAQKGHDTSRLVKNLGDAMQVDDRVSTNISSSGHDSDEAVGKMNTCISSTISSKKDTGVQTDDLNTRNFTNTLSHCGSVIERENTHCSSPEISVEFDGQLNTKKDKQGLSQDRIANLEKENSWCNDQCNQSITEKQTKLLKKCPKRPAWNINKPLKRYVPASEKYPKQLQKQREEKKVRRQMELLQLVERNNSEHLSQNRGTSPEHFHSSYPETESKIRWHLVNKEEEPMKINSNSISEERLQSSPVPAVKTRTQQTQTNTLHLPLKNSYKRETVSEDGETPVMFEPSNFIPYVRTNEIYYLDPDAPLSRPSTDHDCSQEQRLALGSVRDPLLNPNLVKNRDRQQAILKGLSELRQGLLQKQKELETNFMSLAANQEENFSSSF